jgi:hypothetical protein
VVGPLTSFWTVLLRKSKVDRTRRPAETKSALYFDSEEVGTKNPPRVYCFVELVVVLNDMSCSLNIVEMMHI